jgi:hypothetical protein
MLPVVPESERWVLTLDAVRASIDELRSMRNHPFFVAYLYLRQIAAEQRRTSGLKPDWKGGLGPYLEVAGATAQYPYYRPFWNKAAEAGQWWLNKNLGGSFARSSLRVGSAQLRVVDYDRDTHTFSLRRRHWALAREHLLGGKQLPAEMLAAFLLRDFGFITDGVPPTGSDLVSLFASEFGYRNSRSPTEFEHLYRRTGEADESWFEPFTGSEPEQPEPARSEPERSEPER